jgi:aryl-alcohol dehydrogenase-like predicted oxidoreductase
MRVITQHAENIKAVADAAIKRLNADRIHLLCQHLVDLNVPMEEVAYK